MEYSIKTNKLVKTFDTVIAVDGIDLAVRSGSITALLGGNGAGKTTTLSMILGLVHPTSGRIELFGYSLTEHHHKLLSLCNFSSPYVDLPNRLTIRQNLTVYGNLYNVSSLDDRIRELAEQLQIDGLLDRRHGSLSAGQRTRASLAKALINTPRLLILDEPTASLDPETAHWVRELLRNYRAKTGATIFMSSHNMIEVERISDDVVIMKNGRIVEQGTSHSLQGLYNRSSLEEVFLDIANTH